MEMAEVIHDELDLRLNSTKFYTDSKVVLGYIHKSKSFYIYVHNRVQRIHQTTTTDQWHYVPMDDNTANHTSRSLTETC